MILKGDNIMAAINATQHSIAQHSTVQYSTAQYSTAQYSTAQHSIAQHSTLVDMREQELSSDFVHQ